MWPVLPAVSSHDCALWVVRVVSCLFCLFCHLTCMLCWKHVLFSRLVLDYGSVKWRYAGRYCSLLSYAITSFWTITPGTFSLKMRFCSWSELVAFTHQGVARGSGCRHWRYRTTGVGPSRPVSGPRRRSRQPVFRRRTAHFSSSERHLTTVVALLLIYSLCSVSSLLTSCVKLTFSWACGFFAI